MLVAAIQRLAVRGAPLLGVVGGYGVALAAARAGGDEPTLRADAARLADARPTAVNLGWAVQRVLAAALAAPAGGRAAAAVAEAHALAAQDAAASAAMATHGLALVPENARVLTHCNTGRLVSAGAGTAFAVVEAAHRHGRLAHLWVDETRPLLQGGRLTAYEAAGAGMPHSVLVDGAAGSLFAAGAVDLVVVGADRIAADGSVANKVGTYPLAVLAHHHGVPFVVVAPTSTLDLATAAGADIVVEQRAAAEVTAYAGVPVCPAGSAAYNPAFDVTPPQLLTALVTEVGAAQPVNHESIAALVALSIAALVALSIAACSR
jgi:methylthioribose-1-phosphate isomerase